MNQEPNKLLHIYSGMAAGAFVAIGLVGRVSNLGLLGSESLVAIWFVIAGVLAPICALLFVRYPIVPRTLFVVLWLAFWPLIGAVSAVMPSDSPRHGE